MNITEVTRLQKYVNSHVNWLHEILGTGEYWNHSERIKHSSSDEGSQVAPLRLMIKDHKSWVEDSGKPPPSCPVCNGKAEFNCHLSELLSVIYGPVVQEASGAEINSTNDLLSSINALNSNLRRENVAKEDDSDEESLFCDYCQDCNRPPPTRQEIERAEDVIEATRRRKINSAMNISNTLRSKLKALRAASSLYHRACIHQSSDTGAELGQANEFFTVGEDSKRIRT